MPHTDPSRLVFAPRQLLGRLTLGLLTLRLVACSSTPGAQQEQAGAPPVAPAVTTTSDLSDRTWRSAVSGYGPVELDRANGSDAPNDGGPLIIEGVTYQKGLGVHSNSRVVYALEGRCSSFTSVIGLNDYKLTQALGAGGSVVFQVYADGAKLYDSGVMRGDSPARSVSLNMSGKQELQLVTTDGGDGRVNDHADWARARVTCDTSTLPSPSNRFTYTPVSPQAHYVTEQQGEAVKGKLYVFGGFDDQKRCCTPTDRAYRFDPATGTWTALASMPLRGVTHAGMTSDGTNIYFAGGYGPDATWTQQVFGTKAVWRYNIAANTYTRLPDLPVERAAGQLEYLNGQLHYFGGTNMARTQDISDHYVLDLSAGASSWRAAAPLPNGRNHFGAAVMGGKIYAIGGQHGHDGNAVTQTSVHAYDPATNSWTLRQSLPRARSHIENSTFVLGGRIIVAGGEVWSGNAIADVTAYDPATNSWTALTPLPTGRIGGVAAPLGAGFMFTGGSGSKSGWLATPPNP